MLVGLFIDLTLGMGWHCSGKEKSFRRNCLVVTLKEWSANSLIDTAAECGMAAT